MHWWMMLRTSWLVRAGMPSGAFRFAVDISWYVDSKVNILLFSDFLPSMVPQVPEKPLSSTV